jgi:hypothetical protein
MAIALVGLVVPNEQTLAGTPSRVSTLVSDWSASGIVTTYQESSARLSYRGSWTIARYPRYLGGKARSSRDRLARATFQFNGNGVAWIGPVGPTRGKAKVYIDGKYAKTVDTNASVFRPARVLFKATFGSVRSRRLTIVVMGTKGHAMVAIDAIFVRNVRQQPLVQPSAQPVPEADPTLTPTSMPLPAAPSGIPIAYGVFEDAGMVGSPSAMEAMITDLRSHGIGSVMFTNGFLRHQLPLADVSDARNFPVFASWMMGDLQERWWNLAATPNIATARQVIGPMVDELKVHPSIRGYNLVDDATPDKNELMRLAVQVFRERDPARPASPMMVENDLGQLVFDYVRPDAFLTYNYPADETTTPCSWARTFVDEIRYTTRTKAASVPLWLVLQTHRTTFGPVGTKLRYPSAEEVRLQNWIALGEGAQGIWWFIYSSQQGWLGLRDQPALYTEVGDLARRTTALPRFTKQVDQVSAGADYASTLTDSTGARYVVIANTSCAARDVTLTTSSLSGRLLDVESGQTFAFDEPIPIRGGDGRVFRHLP